MGLPVRVVRGVAADAAAAAAAERGTEDDGGGGCGGTRVEAVDIVDIVSGSLFWWGWVDILIVGLIFSIFFIFWEGEFQMG
jgi:hypothetical protein